MFGIVFFTGFFVAFWITAVMFKANDVLRKQTALKVTASPLAFPVKIALGSSLLHRRLFVTISGSPYHLRSLLYSAFKLVFTFTCLALHFSTMIRFGCSLRNMSMIWWWSRFLLFTEWEKTSRSRCSGMGPSGTYSWCLLVVQRRCFVASIDSFSTPRNSSILGCYIHHCRQWYMI